MNILIAVKGVNNCKTREYKMELLRLVQKCEEKYFTEKNEQHNAVNTIQRVER